jgi:hypothetical protein
MYRKDNHYQLLVGKINLLPIQQQRILAIYMENGHVLLNVTRNTPYDAQHTQIKDTIHYL